MTKEGYKQIMLDIESGKYDGKEKEAMIAKCKAFEQTMADRKAAEKE